MLSFTMSMKTILTILGYEYIIESIFLSASWLAKYFSAETDEYYITIVRLFVPLQILCRPLLEQGYLTAVPAILFTYSSAFSYKVKDSSPFSFLDISFSLTFLSFMSKGF